MRASRSRREASFVPLLGILVVLLLIWSSMIKLYGKGSSYQGTVNILLTNNDLDQAFDEAAMTSLLKDEQQDSEVETVAEEETQEPSDSIMMNDAQMDVGIEVDPSFANHTYFPRHLLPPPQLRFPSNKILRYQMQNCLRGRDGSKLGLRESGVLWSNYQKNMDPIQLLKVIPDASVVLACNAERPTKSITKDNRVNGKRLISSTRGIVDNYCLGSIKVQQLVCRRELAKLYGCDYEELGIQPAQYILANKGECLRLLKFAEKTNRPWLLKPSASERGRGIRFYPDSGALIKEIVDGGGCSKKHMFFDYLAQEYVLKPALLSKRYNINGIGSTV